MKKDIQLVPIVEDNRIEFHGRKAIKVNIDLSLLPKYIADILINNYCKALLPMGILSKEESLVYFDITDAHHLSGVQSQLRIDQVFTGIIEGVYILENYLFINDGFHLDWDHIYFKDKEIKFIFEPEEDKALDLSSNQANKILRLIYDSLEIVEDEEWNYSANQLLSLIKPKDSLLEIQRKTSRLAREISSRDWPDLSSLRQF